MEGIYTHNKTGNTYAIADVAKLKDGDAWVDCVIYVSWGTGKNDVYVRRTEDFKQKFTKKP
jgi:hypothetical protein